MREVDRWVIEHGGYLGKLPDQRHRGLGPDYGRIIPGAVFYAIPAAVLDA